jgi:ATP-dependent helicase HrpA
MADIISALSSYQVIIVSAETGSGKSTQIPKYCLDAGQRKIAVTQPRRIAATSLAARVSQELGCAPGTDVGYRIRFDEKADARTKITFMTDGVLLRKIQSDRMLSEYDTIMID